MSHVLCPLRLRRPGPALACFALALVVSALRPTAAAAQRHVGVPLAWGRNHGGQLGNGTLIDNPAPSPVLNLSGVVAVTGGDKHSAALKADGSVWTWGTNTFGQLGDGTYDDSFVPVPVASLNDVVAIHGGYEHNVALKSDGTVWTWGNNDHGQLGIGIFGGTRNTPVKVDNLSGVIAVGADVAYDHFSLALKADGSVWTWGDNTSGQLGDGTFTNRSTPVQVANLPAVIAIATCSGHCLALAPAGTVWAWGANDHGQLGNGTFTPVPPGGIPTPAPVLNLSSVVGIADSGPGNHSIALKGDGTVWTWGANDGGQLGQGTIGPAPGISLPGQVVNPDGTVFDSVVGVAFQAAGGRAIKSDGSVWAWGGNDYGQLGIGTVGPPSTNPVLVPGVVAPVALGCALSVSLAVDIAAPYSWSGILQPVNADGTSVFKRGSTVQVKFQLTGASAGITDAQARFGYAQIDSSYPGAVNETVSNAAGTSGILFQYDAGSGQYVYNWRTNGLGTGQYLLRIDLGDGITRTVVVGLR